MIIIESVGYNITIEISSKPGNDFCVSEEMLAMLKIELEPELAFHEDVSLMEIVESEHFMTITFLDVDSKDITPLINAYTHIINDLTGGDCL
ncbi:hypothetical protein SIPHO082v1_p0022 [Vibrio phage 294E48.1]|nr:hypothetical protein SIPHO082v1_p0022 [Vibrio phage 294E48.1]